MGAKSQIVSSEYQAQVEAYQALTGKFQSLLADQQQLESQLHENTMVFDVRFFLFLDGKYNS
jgi:chaperonin cofactor prefoldin